MTTESRVLGIDLASRSWRDNGSAVLSFQAGESPSWTRVKCGCIPWPEKESLSPRALAKVIQSVAAEQNVCAVSLDGPQGWREPNASKRAGVGRVCEYEAKCQGKTGEFGKTYPQTQHGWISFCIQVFEELLRDQPDILVNDPSLRHLTARHDGRFWLLECFPTSTWRTSGLRQLPGKGRIRKQLDVIKAFAETLWTRYGLPRDFVWTEAQSHDDLQAIVAALPAAALIGGPGHVKPHGQPARWIPEKKHWVEGLIWDAIPPADLLELKIDGPDVGQTRTRRAEPSGENPILLDDRDDNGEKLIATGVRLFQQLVAKARAGESIGIGYAQFVAFVHGRENFFDVANRN